MVLSLALAGVGAHAADLGALRVLSASGDPLRAEIEITSYTPEEAGTLQVKLASADIYRQTQVEYPPALGELQLAVQDRPNGRKVIQVSSATPIPASTVDLLVELTWNLGRFIRQYSFVMNAPAAQVSAPTVSAEPLPPVAVAPGDTLFDIARRVQPDGATVYQTLLALFHANPQSFINGNMNLLRAGANLSIPGSEAVLAENDAAARRNMLSQGEAYTLYRERLAQAAAGATPLAAGGAPAQSAGAIEPASPEPVPAPPKGDELRLSNDGTAQSDAANGQAVKDRLEEERSATERAIEESESRVKELQANITAMRSLLESQNQTLVGMEQRAAPADAPKESELPAAPAAEAPPAAPVPDAVSAEATPPTLAVDSNWATDNGIAAFVGVLAVLGVILGVFALRRRSRPETEFDAGDAEPTPVPPAAPAAAASPFDAFAIDTFPKPVAGYAAARAASAYHDDEDDLDDEPPLNPPLAPVEPIDFGFDLDLDKPPSDGPATPLVATPAGGVAGRAEPVMAAAPFSGTASGAGIATTSTAAPGSTPGAIPSLGSTPASTSPAFTAQPSSPTASAAAATASAAAAVPTRSTSATPLAGGDTPPVTAPSAPAVIPPASPEPSPPVTPKAPAPFVTPPATPPVLPDLAIPASGGLTLDTNVGGLPTASTKLDLARAYIDIGDRVGARELLNEVVKTGSEAQRHRARDLLATL